jgi:hypothetical protein
MSAARIPMIFMDFLSWGDVLAGISHFGTAPMRSERHLPQVNDKLRNIPEPEPKNRKRGQNYFTLAEER